MSTTIKAREIWVRPNYNQVKYNKNEYCPARNVQRTHKFNADMWVYIFIPNGNVCVSNWSLIWLISICAVFIFLPLLHGMRRTRSARLLLIHCTRKPNAIESTFNTHKFAKWKNVNIYIPKNEKKEKKNTTDNNKFDSFVSVDNLFKFAFVAAA